MSDVKIRTADPDKDFDQVYEIELACYDEPWSRSEFHEEFHWNKRATWFVAHIDEKIVGFAGMWSKLFESHIVNLAVLPGFRKKGIAGKLVSALVSAARRGLTARYIFLEVRTTNTAAINLYKKFDFRIVTKVEGYYVEDGGSALIMIKEFSK